MTNLKLLKVYILKAYRFVRYGFKAPRHRSGNQIYISPVHGVCDYCKDPGTLIILECDFMVDAAICSKCLEKALSYTQS